MTAASHVGVWFCDLPFDRLVWDQHVKEHFWLPPDARVTIDLFYERLHPEDRERTRAAIEESIAQRTRYDVGYRTVAPDGRVKWIHAIGHAHYDAEEKPVRFDGVTIDITEHKEAEEAIRQQTAQFEALFNGSPQGIYLVDADFKIRQVNPVALPMFGDIPDLIGRDFGEVIHQLWGNDYAGEIVQRFRHTLATGESYVAPERVEKRRDRGVTESYEWQINRIPLPDGRHGVVCYVRDVAERVHAGRKLRESREEMKRQRRQYEAILSNTPDLAYVWDRNHRFTYVNEGLLRMWGRTWEEAIGKNCLELGYEPWHAELHDREIEQVIATKQPIRGEVPFAGTFGRRIYDYILVPVFDAHGNVEAVAGTTRDVTERKMQEERFRAFVTTSSEVVYRMSADWSEMRQLDGREFIADTSEPSENWMEKYIHPDDRERVAEAAQEAIRTKKPFQLEHRVIRRDGSLGWTASRAIPLLDPKGEITEWFGAASDVTQRREMEDLLRHSRDQIRLISDAVPVLISYIDTDSRYRFCNQAYTRWFKLASDKIIGRTMEDVLGAAAWNTIQPYARQALAGEMVDYEAYAQYPTGARWIHATYTPHRDAEGMVQGMIATVSDITELKRQQQALRLSEERYRNLFDSIDEGFCVIEVLFDRAQKPVDYLFHEVNPAFEKQAGMHGAMGRRMLEFVNYIEPHWLENYGGVATTGEPLRFAAEYKGLNRWFDVYAFKVGDRHDRKVAVLFTDITQRIQSEQALRESEERARLASRAKDNFLAQLSHELRTPLTPVLMTAAAMRDDASISGTAREAFAMIERNVALEARLIDDLLDLTRVTRGKLTLRDEVCDVHSLLGQAMEIVRDEVREKRIDLSVGLAARHRHLHGDPARLQQVFWNLLRNAVNFTPYGGSICVTTRESEEASGAIRIEVIDSGVGFEPSQAEHLFEPFFQGESPSATGLGLGLAIARAIVDLHEGSIRGQSKGQGTGATFVVTLPVTPALSASVQVTAGAEGAHADPVYDPSMRLLVVEDHDATKKVLCTLLARAGHSVTAVGTIDEARRVVRAEAFDAVVSDLGLPDGTGIELMEGLHREHGLTGVALSGYGMEEDVRRSRSAGFAAHLVKPVNFEELRRALRVIASARQESDKTR
ncbi:hypothetical protein AYO49_01795 [Verrucomicrobiaceae bacterium SCGC AG-212-N21]|nr:hypothetical protein AYO49_01795 [Verrucomicrobiaceae bacterium SCGC AG-212-N21]